MVRFKQSLTELIQQEFNTLSIEIKEQNWNKKSLPFKQLKSNELLDFPEMTLEDLKVFLTRSYQLSQAVSYLAEMLQNDDTLLLNYVKEHY